MNRLNTILAKMMVAGTLLSAVLITAGLVWYLSAHAGESPGDHIFSGEPKYFSDPVDMLQRAFQPHAIGQRRSLAMIGIFLLLLSPPLRVLLAGIGFILEKNRMYAFISGIVLLVLLISFFW
ncbi:MAG: DUF1634 domain-containing protein [Terrimicrobiaceae bacterium]